MTAWARLPSTYVSTNDSVIQDLEGGAASNGTGTVTLSSNIRRNAAPSSVAHASGASGGTAYIDWKWGLQGSIGWYVRRYFLFSQLPSSSNPRILCMFDSPFTHWIGVRVTPAGHVRLATYDGTTEVQRGSDSVTTITTGKWYRIELYGLFDATGTACACSLVIADSLIETNEQIGPYRGLTLTSNNITDVLWGWIDAGDANTQVNSCDGGINNDQGATQNSFPGRCRNVLYALPINDNAVGANWQNGAGGSTGLFEAVNNLPPIGVADGSSTAGSQIKNANTADTTGNYDAVMQSYTNAGLLTGQYVTLAMSVVTIASSTTANVDGAQLIVSNPAQGSEDATNTGRTAAAGSFGTNWRTTWGTAQLFTPQLAPNSGVSPVARMGRRGTEAGTFECCLLAIAFEVDQIPAAVPVSVSSQLR